MSGPNSDNYKPVAVSIRGRSAVVCYGFIPKPGVKCFDSNNKGLAPGVKTEEQYNTSTPLSTLVGEICVYCANQACVNNPDFNPESTDIEES